MNIRERLIKYLDYKNISKYKFYQKTGFSNGFLDKKGAIGSDNCEKICCEFPDINLEWLIMGKGEMLCCPAVQPAPAAAGGENTTIYKELFEKKELEIKELNQEIGSLKNQIENLTKTITALQFGLDRAKKENAELRGGIAQQPNSSEKLHELPEVPIELVAEQEKKQQKNALK
ncbi:MAG: hypothetical protein LBP85_07490 [Prevotellaceae bacterium]|jgi:ribosomal protein S15P/S13E|nr:hypothetical protein [Prevotellaceae bacterium]